MKIIYKGLEICELKSVWIVWIVWIVWKNLRILMI